MYLQRIMQCMILRDYVKGMEVRALPSYASASSPVTKGYSRMRPPLKLKLFCGSHLDFFRRPSPSSPTNTSMMHTSASRNWPDSPRKSSLLELE